jgi:Undecaprenyl-phosphate glucose phosphotransferase
MSTTSQDLGALVVPFDRFTPLSQGVTTGFALLLDAAVILLTALAVHFLYVGKVESLSAVMAATLLYLVLVLFAFHSVGLYRFTAIVQPLRQTGRIALVCIGAFLLLTTIFFALKVSEQYSRVWAFSLLFGSMALIFCARMVLSRALTESAHRGWIGRQIVVYGGGVQAEKLIERIERLGEPWNRIIGVFDDRLGRIGKSVHGYPVLGNLDDLVAYGRLNQPDEVLIALPWSAEARLLSITHALSVLPANIRLCPEFFHEEAIHGRTSYQFGLPMLSAFEKPLAGWGAIWKRFFDVLTAGVLVLFGAPVLALIATCIYFESGRPIVFRQKRYGFNNELIEVYKFRTMRAADSDALGSRLTERQDPRVTRVGAFLRRTSLDELPQLFNVLKGEMSLIGPRPHAVRTTAGGRLCEDVADRYAVRHKVKPGMTGWAQVNGWRGTMQSEVELQHRLEHDLYYIRHWSPLFDLRILLRTLWTVTSGRNSY